MWLIISVYIGKAVPGQDPGGNHGEKCIEKVIGRKVIPLKLYISSFKSVLCKSLIFIFLYFIRVRIQK